MATRTADVIASATYGAKQCNICAVTVAKMWFSTVKMCQMSARQAQVFTLIIFANWVQESFLHISEMKENISNRVGKSQ